MRYVSAIVVLGIELAACAGRPTPDQHATTVGAPTDHPMSVIIEKAQQAGYQQKKRQR